MSSRVISTTLLASLLFSTTQLSAQGQTGTVTGRVTDAATQSPLIGASVSVADRSGLTDVNGRFNFTGVAAGTHTLRARMLGYQPATQPVTLAGGETVTVDVALAPQAVGLAEIVVVGYGQQAAGNITGAVTRVSSEEFNTGRVVSPAQLIQSKVAGVQVVDNNEPGGGLSVRIRGATSVNASSEPLYVIDGLPIGTGAGGGLSAGRDPLNFLSPDQIESISVLKDASAAAIYGANAASGVVIIQTKSGRGRPHLEYTGSTSISSATRFPSMLNAEQFDSLVRQYAPQHAGLLQTSNTDWFDLVSQSAFGQEHNVSVSGSDPSRNWRIWGGYLNQEGVIRGTVTERLNAGFNYAQRGFGDRLDLRTSFKISRLDDLFTPGGVLSNAAQMGPTQPAFDQNGAFYEWPGNLLTSPDNPVAVLALARDRGITNRRAGNVQVGYRLPWVEGLRANVNLGIDDARAERFTYFSDLLHGQTKTGNDGSDYSQDFSQTNRVAEAYVNYAGALNAMPGVVDVTAGYSYSESEAAYPWTLLSGLIPGATGIIQPRTTQGFNDIQESRLISFLGRVTYNLNDKYLIAASLRRDGSSRFGPENQWGTFPSVSLGWRISQEPFLSGMTALADLKLRASWAKTGNQAFGNYQQYATYRTGDAQTQYQFGSEFVRTVRPGAYNPFIRWESTKSWDVGADFAFSGQRLSGSIDFYLKDTDDLIFNVPVCAGCNLSNFATLNIGSMRNRGFELSLSARLMDRPSGGLRWTADFSAARNTNEVTAIYASNGTTRVLTGLVAGGVGTFVQVLQPGEPINSFYLFEQRYDATGKPIEGGYVDQPTVRDTVACPAAPGCVGLYRPDGVINQDDRRPFHDPAPKWILGHSSYLSFGKFDVSFTMRAYMGNYVYNNVSSNLGTRQELSRGAPYNLHASALETGFATPQYLSDYYVEDASFLRMDNITVGYSLDWGGRPMRLFATVQNAFTMTGYSGVDPTAGLNGIDNNIYPRSRTFTSGLNVRF
jgi:TonB-dependent starch-binding outer membrane protein SusC